MLYVYLLLILLNIFKKVELVLNVERFLPDFIREKWIVKSERIFPNQTNNLFSLFLFNKATYKYIVEKVSEDVKVVLLIYSSEIKS